MGKTEKKNSVYEGGGSYYKRLRLQARHKETGRKISQADIESETERIGNLKGRAGIGEGNLTNYESKGRRPTVDSLNLLIDALLNLSAAPLKAADIRYLFFVYEHDIYKRLASRVEKQWAFDQCKDRLKKIKHPAYLLDNSLTPICGNRYFEEAIGVVEEPLRTRLYSAPYHGAIFGEGLSLIDRVGNPEILVGILGGLRLKYERSGRASWFKIDEYLQNERFKYYWDLSKNISPDYLTQSAEPLMIRDASNVTRTYRVFGESLLLDDRFRFIHYIPV